MPWNNSNKQKKGGFCSSNSILLQLQYPSTPKAWFSKHLNHWRFLFVLLWQQFSRWETWASNAIVLLDSSTQSNWGWMVHPHPHYTADWRQICTQQRNGGSRQSGYYQSTKTQSMERLMTVQCESRVGRHGHLFSYGKKWSWFPGQRGGRECWAIGQSRINPLSLRHSP